MYVFSPKNQPRTQCQIVKSSHYPELPARVLVRIASLLTTWSQQGQHRLIHERPEISAEGPDDLPTGHRCSGLEFVNLAEGDVEAILCSLSLGRNSSASIVDIHDHSGP